MQIVEYLLAMAPYMAAALPFVLLFRIVARRRMRRLGLCESPLREVGVVLFLLFLVGLISQTVLPQIVIGADGTLELVRQRPGYHINLIPFRQFADVMRAADPMYAAINIAGNIVMFMPIGFCVPLLWREFPFWRTALVGAGFSLGVEVLQYPQGRSSDIDDLILNTLGVMAGYGLWRLFVYLFPKAAAHFRVRTA